MQKTFETIADGEAQIIRPPAPLRAKVGSVRIPDADALFAAVDREIARGADGFLTQAREDIAALRGALHEAVTDAARRSAALDRMVTIAHDLKGQGASYGFDLITAIGGQLCALLKSGRANGSHGLRIAAAHLEAMSLVVEHRIGGDGGELGAAMAGRLEELAGTAGD